MYALYGLAAAALSAPAAMVAKVGGVFGPLRHPHLLQPYSAYYDHLASHYGGPWRVVFPYTQVVQLEEFTDTWAAFLWKNGRFNCS
jgi:hypothetical protein